METALISLVCFAIIILGTLTTIMTSFNAASTVSGSLKEMEEQAADIRRTEISAVPPTNYEGGDIYLTVNNEGQTNLAQFSKWDIIVQYENGMTNYINYTTNNPPGNNEWTVEAIYVGNDPEIWNPNILNPDERVMVIVNIDPDVSTGDRIAITVATPNGVTAQCQVEHR